MSPVMGDEGGRWAWTGEGWGEGMELGRGGEGGGAKNGAFVHEGGGRKWL